MQHSDLLELISGKALNYLESKYNQNCCKYDDVSEPISLDFPYWAKLNGKYGLISPDGEELTKFKYDNVYEFTRFNTKMNNSFATVMMYFDNGEVREFYVDTDGDEYDINYNRHNFNFDSEGREV